jgi:hypothetical protein
LNEIFAVSVPGHGQQKISSRLFLPAAIPNLALLIFCTLIKDQKPVLKTEQIDSQKNPAFPDFPGENAARTEMNYRMPGIDSDFGERIIVVVWMTGNRVICNQNK